MRNSCHSTGGKLEPDHQKKLMSFVTAFAVVPNAIPWSETRNRIISNPTLHLESRMHPAILGSEGLKIQSWSIISLRQAKLSYLCSDYQKYPSTTIESGDSDFFLIIFYSAFFENKDISILGEDGGSGEEENNPRYAEIEEKFKSCSIPALKRYFPSTFPLLIQEREGKLVNKLHVDVHGRKPVHLARLNIYTSYMKTT